VVKSVKEREGRWMINAQPSIQKDTNPYFVQRTGWDYKEKRYYCQAVI